MLCYALRLFQFFLAFILLLMRVYAPDWHWSPVYPGTQEHVCPLIKFMHVPPFRQDELVQCVITVL